MGSLPSCPDCGVRTLHAWDARCPVAELIRARVPEWRRRELVILAKHGRVAVWARAGGTL